MSAKTTLCAALTHEIEALHTFFEGWFNGTLSKNTFDSAFLPRLALEFTMIPPSGTIASLPDLTGNLRNAHNTSPSLEIAIQNVVIRQTFPGHALVTYEEWQRTKKDQGPEITARVSTALVATGDTPVWLHLHETWMKPESPPSRFLDS
ncbi:unnamed protein product [Chondrus crispus]|uniref:DUF4440 domain-containing protein n=1 Tax=Chondrus crispus TaxID=2769 RepID=R7QUE1_CHOCR|nr:unnamed protein product [Chondrus crispus]CDF41091.1 unnamed protein product [Chondrus crispus]|eukprot:XP_005711385.1 unnamed protein product [Chondrus crispus]